MGQLTKCRSIQITNDKLRITNEMPNTFLRDEEQGTREKGYRGYKDSRDNATQIITNRPK